MRLDRLTLKAQEARAASQGIVRPILQKVGADPDAVSVHVEDAIGSIPKVSGAAQQGVSIEPLCLTLEP